MPLQNFHRKKKKKEKPPKKRTKRGPDRARKIQRETEVEVEVVEIDHDSDKLDGDGYIGKSSTRGLLDKASVRLPTIQPQRNDREQFPVTSPTVGYQIRWYT